MRQDQFGNIWPKNESLSQNVRTTGRGKGDETERRSDKRRGRLKKGLQMKERVLIEFVRMSRADGIHNSVREGSSPLRLRLVDKLRRNASPARLRADSELSCVKPL